MKHPKGTGEGEGVRTTGGARVWTFGHGSRGKIGAKPKSRGTDDTQQLNPGFGKKMFYRRSLEEQGLKLKFPITTEI